ncbi:amino acid ABC transporter substrate-binding protein [Ectothiorhodospiraceae bacterium WFHF3C12]|nr:amino acid ABC transporter substrate-binding protein [Ectothiorhodospiraceae bacterium WFHF3C12]
MRATWAIALSAGLVLVQIASTALAGETLQKVRERGHIRCGVSQGLPGFSSPSGDQGSWQGIDVDYCHALAAAVLGDRSKVRFRPLSAKERFTALQSGEIDVLSRNTTWTATRDTALGIHFVGVIYYDGQGFMVPKSLGLDSARQLGGAAVCSNAGTTTELNMADYFRANGMDFEPVVFENTDEVIAAYQAGRCDVYTTDRSGLYAQRIKLEDPDAHEVLPEVISKEPLGPAVRQGDDEWFNIAKWTLFALFQAEELGIDSGNVEQHLDSENPRVKRFLGVDGSIGENLGLNDRWAYRIVKQVGNYAQMYERHLASEPLAIPRGQNKLWNDGGLHYPPAFR